MWLRSITLFIFSRIFGSDLSRARSTEGHDTHLTTTLAHNLKVGGGGVGSTMAGKAIGNQVEIHVKYGAEPTVKGAFPAQGMTYVVDLVAPGLRICGQVTYFGLLLSASNPVTMHYPCAWRGVGLNRWTSRKPQVRRLFEQFRDQIFRSSLHCHIDEAGIGGGI